jgi:hypothetical protein
MMHIHMYGFRCDLNESIHECKTHTYACTSDSRSVLKVHKLCSHASLARFFFIDDNVFSLMSGTTLFMYPLYIACHDYKNFNYMYNAVSVLCRISQSHINSHAHLN